jgi:integrase
MPEVAVAHLTQRASRVGFHLFASRWYAEVEPSVRQRTAESLRWQLSYHLLPFFKDHTLEQITVAEVDRYRTEKLAEERLAASSINKTMRLLGQILELAVEHELVDRNPMWINRPRRLVRAAPARHTHLERPSHIAALLDAAGELDREASQGHRSRRATLSTLVFAGLRISELLELRWQDVDMNDGRLIVRTGKTPAAAREIRMLPTLVEELGLLRATVPGPRHQRVFAGHRGGAPQAENLRRRVLRPACERANQRLDEAEGSHLPEPVTHHALRRTFASVAFAIGWTPPQVMEALGHTDARLTLNIYARTMRRRSLTKSRRFDTWSVSPEATAARVAPAELRAPA